MDILDAPCGNQIIPKYNPNNYQSSTYRTDNIDSEKYLEVKPI